MRLRHIPGAEQMIEENPHVVHGAKEKKGTWQQIFENDHPIRIEVGMGKGQFILEQASRNPDVNFVGIEKYSTVLLKAIRKRENRWNCPISISYVRMPENWQRFLDRGK